MIDRGIKKLQNEVNELKRGMKGLRDENKELKEALAKTREELQKLKVQVESKKLLAEVSQQSGFRRPARYNHIIEVEV